MTVEPQRGDDWPHVHHATVDGQRFVVRLRPDEPGTYDFDWLTGPRDYGFSSVRSNGSAMSFAEIERAIRDFLAQVGPDTGYIP